MNKELQKFIGDTLSAHSLTEVNEKICNDSISSALQEAVTFGRVSVLKEFDGMCKADAFVGFSDLEWECIQKFFAFNKAISNWDK